jgi:hypothetical protein
MTSKAVEQKLRDLKSDVQSLREYLDEFEEGVRSDDDKHLDDHVESLVWLHGEARFLAGRFHLIENLHPQFDFHDYEVMGQIDFIEERAYNLLDYIFDGEFELGESNLYRKHPLKQLPEDRF